jgi:hypothetical protein
MARTTSTRSIRVNVYDGPHHGRILEVPANARHLVLPNPMPAGQMWGPGRTNPSEFTAREYNYELRTSAEGKPYLSYVEGKRHAFTIPVQTSTPISFNALSLVTAASDAGYNYGIGSNGTRQERYAMLRKSQLALVEYISRLEREAYPSVYQGSRFSI